MSRSVWRKADLNLYVPRCGCCGKYGKEEDFLEHWFFRGPYLIGCIQDRLYDNARTIKEINNESRLVRSV